MNRQYRILNNSRGFSMMELMIAVVIIGLLAGIIGVRMMGSLDDAKVGTVQGQISSFESALKLFKLKCGRFPTTEQGLEALISNPTIGKGCKKYPDGGFWDKDYLPADPWDLPYQYMYPGQHNTNSFDIWSNGQDGEEGTGDDIGNWLANEEE